MKYGRLEISPVVIVALIGFVTLYLITDLILNPDVSEQEEIVEK